MEWLSMKEACSKNLQRRLRKAHAGKQQEAMWLESLALSCAGAGNMEQAGKYLVHCIRKNPRTPEGLSWHSERYP